MGANARSAGLLLHPSSLPSGNLGDATRWLDFLQAAGVGVWQMLPLGIPLTGLSPYQCASAFAANPALFPAVTADKRSFARWSRQQSHWLDDFARFMVIKQSLGGTPWMHWPQPLRDREATALAAFDDEYADALREVKLTQYNLATYWKSLRADAAARGIRLFGDMPIFVAHDSADVWAKRELFVLDAAGEPTVVAGVPPDYFSETGQRWGNPHYNWEAMRADNFAWWRQRLAAHFEWFDLVRIDHFRGLAAVWEIPAQEPTAINGKWVEVPGDALLQSVADDMGALPLVAEDLGVITPDVTALRLKYGLPGMSVLQFAFDHFADNPHKPENVVPATVYYTGTHDNDTTVGWWRSLPEPVREQVAGQLHLAGIEVNEKTILETMIGTILDSPAELAVLPFQDVLGLGSEARMNMPGTENGNWTWRFDWADVLPEMAPRLREQLQKAQRCERT